MGIVEFARKYMRFLDIKLSRKQCERIVARYIDTTYSEEDPEELLERLAEVFGCEEGG